MASLVVAEHDHATLKGATLNTITAALQCGGDVHVLVAGADAGAAAQAATQVVGVARVLHADAPSLSAQLAENVAAQVLAEAGHVREALLALEPVYPPARDVGVVVFLGDDLDVEKHE